MSILEYFRKKESSETLIDSVYEIGSLGFAAGKMCINFYDVYQNIHDGNITFELVKKCGCFKSEYGNEIKSLMEMVDTLREDGYLSKKQWLQKREKASNHFDFVKEDIQSSSQLAKMTPMDLDKTAIICNIVKTLGYFNLRDVEILSMVIQEYGLQKDASMVANIATFLAENLSSIPIEETQLYAKHQKQGKVYQFRKISSKKK